MKIQILSNAKGDILATMPLYQKVDQDAPDMICFSEVEGQSCSIVEMPNELVAMDFDELVKNFKITTSLVGIIEPKNNQ